MTLNINEIITATDQQGNQQSNAYQAIKDQFEPVLLRELLAYTDNNKTHSARIAGLHLSTLNRKLRQHGLVIKKQVRSGGEQS